MSVRVADLLFGRSLSDPERARREKEAGTNVGMVDAAERRWNIRMEHISGHRWNVILAGGDGRRLLPLTRRIAGDERPKQFCAVVGGQTLLDQTRSRIWNLGAPERTCVVVTKSHERFYADDRSAEASLTSWLVQPLNQGTAPAILYTLMRLRELDSGAVVAFFPSDHHFADEHRFIACIRLAFEAAECAP